MYVCLAVNYYGLMVVAGIYASSLHASNAGEIFLFWGNFFPGGGLFSAKIEDFFHHWGDFCRYFFLGRFISVIFFPTFIFADSWLASNKSVLAECCLVCSIRAALYAKGRLY